MCAWWWGHNHYHILLLTTMQWVSDIQDEFRVAIMLCKTLCDCTANVTSSEKPLATYTETELATSCPVRLVEYPLLQMLGTT